MEVKRRAMAQLGSLGSGAAKKKWGQGRGQAGGGRSLSDAPFAALRTGKAPGTWVSRNRSFIGIWHHIPSNRHQVLLPIVGKKMFQTPPRVSTTKQEKKNNLLFFFFWGGATIPKKNK